MIVRAVVVDGDGRFCFCQVRRDDDFGKAELIELSGGGVEAGETLEEALRRALREELGAEPALLGKLGVVSDYYNLIHRHNIIHYFLCRARSFGETWLTSHERDSGQRPPRRLGYEEALREHERCSESRRGRLVARRETPVLRRAREMLAEMGEDGPWN